MTTLACDTCIVICDGDHGVRFCGGKEVVPSPVGARLFPFSRIRGRSPQRVELDCTRTDEHPVNGTHWHETPGGYRLTWEIPVGVIWSAE
jgi:hypothetical protein